MKYSDTELLDDIRAVADTLGHVPSLQEYRDQGSHSVTTYYDRFGSWQAAVEAAGFEPQDPQEAIDADELLCALRQLATNSETAPTAPEMNERGPYWASTYRRRFGSWTNALEAAGFAVDSSRRRSSPSERALRAELHRLADELGSPPSTREMDTLGEYGSSTYTRRFGSWPAALEAADLDPDTSSPEISDAALLADLRRLHTELGTKPTSTDVADQGAYSVATYQRRFGSWSDALDAAFDANGSDQS